MGVSYAVIIESLAFFAIVGVPIALVMIGMAATSSGRRTIVRWLGGKPGPAVGVACLVAAVATSGSLYLSDVVGFPPCLLCWYQRIAMYPLVPVLGVAWLTRTPGAWKLALPLPLIGGAISLYHVVLQYRPNLELVACDASNPCSARFVAAFGFVSIPVLAGAAFLMITALLVAESVIEREVAAQTSD
jgi:disulfide bond formation protein DsbB